MKKFTALAAVAVAGMMATPASADWFDVDLYGSIAGAVSLPEDVDTKNIINPASNEEISFDEGWGVVGAIGDRDARFFRTEFEVGYRSWDVDQLTDSNGIGGPFNMTGDAEIWNVGFNALYDFENDGAITPYVGAGAGAAYVSVDTNRSSAPTSNVWQAEDWGFYLQGIAGVGFDVNEDAELFTEYRYFRTFGVNAESNFGAFTPDTNEEQFANHTFFVGIRFNF